AAAAGRRQRRHAGLALRRIRAGRPAEQPGQGPPPADAGTAGAAGPGVPRRVREGAQREGLDQPGRGGGAVSGGGGGAPPGRPPTPRGPACPAPPPPRALPAPGATPRLRHTPGLGALPNVEIVAVCNRRPESTAAAAQEFDIPRTFAAWEEVVASPDVDAVV